MRNIVRKHHKKFFLIGGLMIILNLLWLLISSLGRADDFLLIIDDTTPPNIYFTDITGFNVETIEENLNAFTWYRNNIPYSFYDESLVLMMNLDNDAKDVSIYGNDGAVTGAIWTHYGRYNGAYRFDGQDDYIQIENSESLNITGQISIEVRIRLLGEIPGWDIVDQSIDRYIFDENKGISPKALHVMGNIYAIVYADSNNNGVLKTIQISDNGQIAKPNIDTLEFDTEEGENPDIVHIVNDIYAIAYTNKNNNGAIKTIQISDNGQINDTIIDNMLFENSNCDSPEIIKVNNDIYAIAYTDGSNNGIFKTISVSDDGQIADTTIDTLIFDNDKALTPAIILITGNIYAVAYTQNNNGVLKTIQISDNGQMIDTTIDTLIFEDNQTASPEIVKINNDIYAVVYSDGNNDGFIKTIEISGTGQITDTALDDFEFDDNKGIMPYILPLSNTVYAIAYTDGSNKGVCKILEIGADGQINDIILDTMIFDENKGKDSNIIRISDTMIAIVYAGHDDDGYITTIQIMSAIGNILSKENAYAIGANFTTASSSINGYTISGLIVSGRNFIATTYDANEGINRLYINNVSVAQQTLTENINSNTNNLFIGEGFNGIIDEIRIRNKTLSEDEIQQHYRSNFNKYAPDSWQSETSQFGLVTGAYIYYACAQDVAGNTGCTEARTITIGMPILPLEVGSPTSFSFSGIQTIGIPQEIIGQFTGENYFWIHDPMGGNSGYYSTISISDLIGAQYTLPKENIYMQAASGITLLTGMANPRVQTYSGLNDYHTIASPITYIHRVAGENFGITGTYGNQPILKIIVPSYQHADDYQGTLTITLYEL